MRLFVDTSGILALIDRDDPAHAAVVAAFARGRDGPFVTHAYVVIETLAVARRWFGPAVASDIIDRVIPTLEVTRSRCRGGLPEGRRAHGRLRALNAGRSVLNHDR